MAQKSKPKPKPKFTDAERHARFVEMAAKVEASDDPRDFDRAFERITRSPPGSKSKSAKIR
jgi:hypothetical protein